MSQPDGRAIQSLFGSPRYEGRVVGDAQEAGIARLVAFQLDVGGLIWVNPELVSSVQRQSEGIVLIRFAAGQPQQAAQVRGEAADIVQKLCEIEADVVFDRRARAAAAEPAESVGLFGAGLNARMK